ncbi:hypothetical protein JTB14_009223 [Gonioctena quinquepunctata]|nr:hypothetical protein JTB14_009223 [Gonioctena quinquepunctata]
MRQFKWAHVCNPGFYPRYTVHTQGTGGCLVAQLEDIRRLGKPGSHVNEPFAIETVLGCIVMGKEGLIFRYASKFLFCNFSLDDTLKQFWELEQVPDVMTRSPRNEKSENIFKDSHIRLTSGRCVFLMNSIILVIPDN